MRKNISKILLLLILATGLVGCPGPSPSNNQESQITHSTRFPINTLQTGTRPISLVDSKPKLLNGGTLPTLPPGTTVEFGRSATWTISYFCRGTGNALQIPVVSPTSETFGPIIVQPGGPGGPSTSPISEALDVTASQSTPTPVNNGEFWYGTVTITANPKALGGIYARVVVEATIKIAVPGITEPYLEKASNNMYLKFLP